MPSQPIFSSPWFVVLQCIGYASGHRLVGDFAKLEIVQVTLDCATDIRFRTLSIDPRA